MKLFCYKNLELIILEKMNMFIDVLPHTEEYEKVEPMDLFIYTINRICQRQQ